MFDHPSRRAFLGGVAAFSAWASIPRLAMAAGGRDPRFITIVLRGAMDGLGCVAPVGDPAYDEVRDDDAMPFTGDKSGLLLNNFFMLNRNLPTVADLYTRGEALFVHAVHTPYRDRSHFEGQDILENGTTSQSHHKDGWLGRALAQMPVDSGVRRGGGFAAASGTPLLLRGASNIVTWLPAGMPTASDDTRLRLMNLYEHTDPVLAEAMAEGLALEKLAGSEMEITAQIDAGMESMGMESRGAARQELAAATAAARAMAADDGARVGFLDLSGFDTHRSQTLIDGRLGRSLTRLDNVILALKRGLGPVWKDTVIAVVTEFGRTVRFNGSNGTDHGSGTVAMLLGGAVAGGKVVADWPGLREQDLFEGRDLMPTTDLRAVMKGVLRDHLGLDQAVLGSAVFPETAHLRPIDNLIA
ncbi:DUF1501 domain-containing protein [Acuticoccus sp. MNP-M23]|uniref:DUF1501 domain-containing protein n=1 Tax=Acuticoccus sp. MNP-M23 TaxID=3072793 RepID=UPI0028155E65|nr:DUF1501 domain-containing protein [Acuticoccus sp. MNP-M23]WMS41453.1 DUF1501 domain-containing protein [Acuticoccus sp. MNP-M23]